MSYYLKYRPTSVSQLDMAVAREALGKVLTCGRFAHAYLFSGPKGTGKTSSARILAKVLNCAKNRQVLSQLATSLNVSSNNTPARLVEPCDKCESCNAIAMGSSMAVIEMDAASNRGIEDIRQLKERIGLAPMQGLFTVYVIDEVHMLTNEAFNALLKTLEEPPAHAVFVLCTTETHKIPETVISRCTRIQFAKATSKEIVHSLQKAVKGEQLHIDDEALELLASRVDGSFRDGMKLLEQLAQQQTTITKQMVDKLTYFSNEYRVDDLIQALMDNQIQEYLSLLQQRGETGVDFGVLGKRMLESLREELLLKVAQDGHLPKRLFWLIQLVGNAVRDVKMATISSLPLEMAGVEFCMKGFLRTDTAKVGVVDRKKDDSQSVTVMQTPTMRHNETKHVKGAIEFDQVMQQWDSVLKLAKTANHSLEALLRATKPKAVRDNTLLLEVFYAFHKEQLEQQRHHLLLEDMLKTLFGQPMRLEFQLANTTKPTQDDSDVTGKLQDEQVAQAAEDLFG